VLPSVDDAEGAGLLLAEEGLGLGRAMSFHSRLSFAGVQSTCGGSAKAPRGNGSRTMTVYCGVGGLRASFDGAMVGLSLLDGLRDGSRPWTRGIFQARWPVLQHRFGTSVVSHGKQLQRSRSTSNVRDIHQVKCSWLYDMIYVAAYL
jgi:hypothetical protein